MLLDDKIIVIIATTLIAVLAMLCMADPLNLVQNIITGLFGIAVGNSLK